MFNQIKKIIQAIKTFKRAFSEYRKQILILLVVAFIGGVLEGIGINAIIPLFSFATDNQEQATDTISTLIRNTFYYLNIPYNITSLLILIPTIFILKAIVTYLFQYIKIKIVLNYENRIRQELLKKTLEAHWPYLINQKTGYLEKTLMVDTFLSSSMLSYFSEIVLLSVSLVIYILIALNISPIITLLTLLLGILIFLLFQPINLKIKRLAHKEEKMQKNIASFINENVYGMKTIKTSSVSVKITDKAKSLFGRFKDLQVKRMLVSNFNILAIQPIGVIFIIIIFIFFYLTRENFNLASFAVIVYVIQKIFSFIQSGQNKLQTIASNIPYLENVTRYKEEISKNQEKNNGHGEFNFQDKISFKAVTFGYDNETPALKNINLEIKKGSMVGIVGPSGSGKTTMVDLILRLFPPQKGKITIDDVDINDIDVDQWRHNIGYVSQDIFLMNDTIENNIRFYNDKITTEEIVEACQKAQINEFVQLLPEKLKTVVGDRGITLSGGQRQRIILARILVRNPKILILDEATSSLDNESEEKIQEAINALKGKTTVIIIAHRLSTVMASDQLVIIENGEIKEQGSPKNLLENNDSYFYKLHNIGEK